MANLGETQKCQLTGNYYTIEIEYNWPKHQPVVPCPDRPPAHVGPRSWTDYQKLAGNAGAGVTCACISSACREEHISCRNLAAPLSAMFTDHNCVCTAFG